MQHNSIGIVSYLFYLAFIVMFHLYIKYPFLEQKRDKEENNPYPVKGILHVQKKIQKNNHIPER